MPRIEVLTLHFDMYVSNETVTIGPTSMGVPHGNTWHVEATIKETENGKAE